MPVRYEKQTRYRRGHRVFGYGRTGQHRHLGQHGGVGKTTGWKKHDFTHYLIEKKNGFPDPDWRLGGKCGFKLPPTLIRLKKINPINIKDLELSVDQWVTEKKIEKKGETYIVDLGKLDIQKLLGKGEVTKKLDVIVDHASAHAVEKFNEAKCKLTVNIASEEE